jgi:hypothetical protein
VQLWSLRSPAILGFGNENVNSSSAAQAFTPPNTGAASLSYRVFNGRLTIQDNSANSPQTAILMRSGTSASTVTIIENSGNTTTQLPFSLTIQ